jgi:hypothetical protein
VLTRREECWRRLASAGIEEAIRRGSFYVANELSLSASTVNAPIQVTEILVNLRTQHTGGENLQVFRIKQY